MRHCHKAGISMRGSTAGFKAGTSNLLSAKTHQQARCTSMAPQPQPALHLDSKAIRTYSQRTAAAAPDTLVAEETVQQPSVEFLGVLKDMQTVKGVIHTAAAPDLVFDILTDYDSCSRVFRNISGSQTLFTDAGDKQVIQACKWQFLAFKGTFNVHLNVMEVPEERLLVFTLAQSSFMRDFEGRWQVIPLSGGGCRIEHILAVKPLLSIPAAVAPYTSSIFKSQVSALLADLQAEIDRQAAAVAAAAS